MKFQYIVFVFLLSFPSLHIRGQQLNDSPSNLKFKHLSTKDGLSQSSVIAILQDRKGYLWFGTRDGLNKYDGSKFINYRHNSLDSTSISHSWVTTIFEDSKGNIWVGTKEGLNKYNPSKDYFKQYKFESDVNSLADNEIWDLAQIENNSLCISTNRGVSLLNLTLEKFAQIKNEPGNINSLSDNRSRSFLNSNDGNLWISTVEGIDVYNLQKNSFQHFKYPEGTTKEEHVNNAPTLFKDNQNKIWLGYEGGLAFFDSGTNDFLNYTVKGKQVISSAVRSICEDIDGILWIGSYTGLYLMNPKRDVISHIVHNEYNPKSLSQNSIYKITQDSRGDIWIGTWAGGVNYYDRSYDHFKHLSSGANNRMLNYKVISSIVEESDDELWIGTEGGGINIFNRKTGVFNFYLNEPTNVNSLSSNNVKSMLKDSEGNYWIGTHDGGLNFLNPKLKPYKFEKFKDSKKTGIDINDYRILSLFEDIHKNIWIGTLTGGLFLYNRSQKTFSKLDETLKSITCIVQTNDPNIILAGGSSGLEKIDINTNQRTPILFLSDDNSKRKVGAVNIVFQDDDENYWIGTEGLGLFLFNTNTLDTKKFGINQGLPNEVVYGILQDDDNQLWISTNNGISRLDLQTYQFINYNESDGLQSNEFNYGAFLKTKDGDLMFGGTNGFNYFNPKDIVENTFIPQVNIHSFKVNNKPFLNISDAIKKITLKYDQNDFSIDFTALSYSQPNKNSYSYKLTGFDVNYNYIGNNKTATYTNLDSGDYEFHIKASNNNGLWNEKGATLQISILPAPWKTWWAYAFYFIVFTLVLYAIIKLVLTRIKERSELKNEKLEKEKLEEVNKLKLRLFTNISHDFRTPLTLIIGPLEQLLKKESQNNFIKKNLDTIHRNTNILLQLINELLDFRKSESGKLKLYASKNNIVSFSEIIKLSFEELAERRNISYAFNPKHKNIEVWFDKIKYKKILFNLLSNAFKFSKENSKILFNISNDESFVKIEVINFGKVISKENLTFVFERFYQLDQKDVLSGTGIGLALTKSLVEIHHGTIDVKSSEIEGTCFTVLLPLGSDHLTDEECAPIEEQNDDLFLIESPAFVQKEMKVIEIERHEDLIDLDTSKKTILIVEDNVELRAFMKSVFEKSYNIFEAENGEVGFKIAHKENIDLIISDIMMPIMNGLDLCERIKTDIVTSHIPVILLTAKSSEVHRQQGYKLGADTYITKPFDSDILEVRVSNLIKSKENLILKYKKDEILKPKELTITSVDELFLQKAIDIVEANLSNHDFTVTNFISEMNMSRSVIYRKLKALTDQSLIEFIRTIKLKRAGQLILKSQLNISEIAFDLGFNDLKYFRKSFKKLFNELPSEYRTKNIPDATKE